MRRCEGQMVKRFKKALFKKALFRSAMLGCLAVLAACASEAPPATFDLDPALAFDHLRASRRQLAIFEPTTIMPLNSRRILIRTGPDTIAYLHGGQWASELPRLVQDRLIDGFEAAHALRAVGGTGFVADRSLHTDIEHFEVDVSRGEALVEIDAKILGGDGRVVAEKSFSATAPAANDHVPTIIAALREAFAKVVHEIVIWAAPRA
jgi:cholesterol transport system auxiliary component